MGSAITYARRYALTAMLGMITEYDDAKTAKMPPKQKTISNGNQTVRHNGKDYQTFNGYHRQQSAPERERYEPDFEVLPEEEFYFVRIGEDYEDKEISSLWWDNPFNISFCREIVLDC